MQLIVGLLLINATIGYYEDQNAGNAVAALKSQLAPQSKALRGGEFKSIPAANLVPGDIIRIRIGDVIPADVKARRVWPTGPTTAPVWRSCSQSCHMRCRRGPLTAPGRRPDQGRPGIADGRVSPGHQGPRR